MDQTTGLLLPAREVETTHDWPLVGPALELQVDQADLRRALRRAYEERDETAALGAAAARHARQNFTWTRALAAMRERMRVLIGEPSLMTQSASKWRWKIPLAVGLRISIMRKVKSPRASIRWERVVPLCSIRRGNRTGMRDTTGVYTYTFDALNQFASAHQLEDCEHFYQYNSFVSEWIEAGWYSAGHTLSRKYAWGVRIPYLRQRQRLPVPMKMPHRDNPTFESCQAFKIGLPNQGSFNFDNFKGMGSWYSALGEGD